jgi:hypothetical protein
VHVRICGLVHTCMHLGETCVLVHVCVCVHACACVCVYIRMRVCELCSHIWTHLCVCQGRQETLKFDRSMNGYEQ